MLCGGRGLVFLEVAFWTLPVVLKTAFFAYIEKNQPFFACFPKAYVSIEKKTSNILFFLVKNRKRNALQYLWLKK